MEREWIWRIEGEKGEKRNVGDRNDERKDNNRDYEIDNDDSGLGGDDGMVMENDGNDGGNRIGDLYRMKNSNIDWFSEEWGKDRK